MNRHALLVGSIAVGVLLLHGTPFAAEGRNDRGGGHKLVGAWEVEVTVRANKPDCTTAPLHPFPPNPFPSHYTIHEGGTLSESGSRSPPSARGPGHGVWKRVGRNEYVARNVFYGFDANGFLARNMNMRIEISLSRDGNSWIGVSRFLLTDVSDNTRPFCATMVAERIAV